MSEFLAEVIKRSALDQEMTAADKERVLEFLRVYGDFAGFLLQRFEPFGLSHPSGCQLRRRCAASSDPFQSPNGILLGCYNTGDDMKHFGALPLTTQFDRSRSVLNELHPGYGAELVHPVAVAWQNVPFSMGPWVHWPDGPSAEYNLLTIP